MLNPSKTTKTATQWYEIARILAEWLPASILAVWLSSMSQQASLLIGCHDPASILAEWLSSMSQQASLLSGCHDPASILADWLSKVSQQASLLSGCQV